MYARGRIRHRTHSLAVRAGLGLRDAEGGRQGAVFRDESILLVQEATDGGWTLPGGWADVNQSPREGVEREIREESGYEARAIKLAGVYDFRRQGNPNPLPNSIYKIFFVCELTA